MQQPDALLLEALQAAPRRYRMPALPPNVAAARAGEPEAALAFAIEAARGGDAGAEVAQLFVDALASLVRKALAPEAGDPAFQAQVLQAQSPTVAEHLDLAARETADRRAVRAAADAAAHPGKLRHQPAGSVRDRWARIHALAAGEAWADLLAAADADFAFPPHAQAALERLRRGAVLRSHPDVQRYLALCARRGPPAGSDAASAQGRAAARAGSGAEQVTLDAFSTIASLLQEQAAPGTRYRTVGSLLTPHGFPGAADKAKDEWDAAIVRGDGVGQPVDIVLLAEVKASAAAAPPDLGRLLRGLQRLALADPRSEYTFACAGGDLQIAGASLRRLQPLGATLPPHVIYCCASEEAQPAPLAAATRAVLLVQPQAMAFAQRLLAGQAADPQLLAPLWTQLQTAPRLRSALHQYQTATAARAAMLHPDDLVTAVRLRLARPGSHADRGS